MLRYIAKRLLFMVPLLFGITVICFTVMHLAPGSPTDLQTQMNPRASVEMKERLRAMYDLDKPLHEQYLRWVGTAGRPGSGDLFFDGPPAGGGQDPGAAADHDPAERAFPDPDPHRCHPARGDLRRPPGFPLRPDHRASSSLSVLPSPPSGLRCCS